MEIVGRLTGGVVHDFNNILTVITGTIEILAEAVADRPGLVALAGMIADAAARGADLTSHLLAFARGQPSEPRDVNIDGLLVEAARLLRPTLGERIEIETMPAADVPPAWVDPSHLMTAIINVAVIARDAMPAGGKLVFEGRSAVAGSDLSAAHYVLIAVGVSSSGSAIEDRVFADLGLVENLITQSDGHIRSAAKPPAGRRSKSICPGQTWRARGRGLQAMPVSRAAMKQS